jgi:hypothetical protein
MKVKNITAHGSPASEITITVAAVRVFATRTAAIIKSVSVLMKAKVIKKTGQLHKGSTRSASDEKRRLVNGSDALLTSRSTTTNVVRPNDAQLLLSILLRRC